METASIIKTRKKNSHLSVILFYLQFALISYAQKHIWQTTTISAFSRTEETIFFSWGEVKLKDDSKKLNLGN